MYQASQDFHNAVFSPSPISRILLKFGDTILTNEDIRLASGVSVTESINTAKELTIGTCQDALMNATIMNHHGLLSDFEFGECEASLAVKTKTGQYKSTTADVQTVMRFGTGNDVKFEGFSTEPYIKVNGEVTTAQPPMPVHSILTYGNTVYCIGPNGEVWVAAWIDGRTWNYISSRVWDSLESDIWDDIQSTLVPVTDLERWKDQESRTWDEMEIFTWNSFIALPELNEFMYRKITVWAQDKRGMSFHDGFLHEFKQDGSYEEFEYVKLGIFQVNTPKKRRQNYIAIDSKDNMQKFDIDATAFLNSVVYPITIGNYYLKLCSFVGVESATRSFINSTRVLNSAPISGIAITGREILGLIAGAACSIARMTRDGELELAWFAPHNINIGMDLWFNSDIAEYTVAPIDKLQVMGSKTDIGVIVGSGLNAYRLIDNPFLYGLTDAEIRALAVPIYNRLIAFPEFSPIIANARCNWAIQAGDIIEFEFRDVIYKLPIYSQTITWRGSIKVNYVSTGDERRPEVSAENRRIFQQNRSVHEVENTVERFRSEIYNPDGSSKIEQQAQRIELVVNSSNNTIRAANIVASINSAGSEVYIGATHIRMEGIVTANSYFKINLDGSMEATNGKFSGEIIATSGTFGGWRIDSTGLHSPDGRVHINSSGTYSLQAGSGFSIQPDGTIVAIAGRIGGFTLSNSTLTSSGLTIDPSGIVKFGSYASLYANSSNAVFQAYTPLDLDSSKITMGLDYAALTVTDASSTFQSRLYLSRVAQSSGGNMYLAWNQSTGEVMYSTPSSIRYKENIRSLIDNDYDIDLLDPVVFNYKFDDSKRQNIGLIAEEASKACPMLSVTQEVNGQTIIESIDYIMIIPILLREIKKLKSDIKEIQYGVA